MDLRANAVRTSPDRAKSWAVPLASWILGVVFLAAAAAKAWHVHEFQSTVEFLLSGLSNEPRPSLAFIRDLTVLLTISGEGSLGLALLLLARRPRVPAIAASAALVAFTAGLAVLGLSDGAPSCGCFGAWVSASNDAGLSAWIGIARNAGLLLIAGWLALEGAPRPSRHAPHPATPPAARRADAGFSLVEVLVVIAVIAVLLAILIPAITAVRRAGHRTTLLSSQNQHAVALFQYVQAEADYLPYLAEPGRPEAGVLAHLPWHLAWPYSGSPPSYFRGQSRFWPTALLAHGLDLSGLHQNAMHDDVSGVVGTYVWLTHAAAARPRYWVGIDPPPEASLFSGVRLSECAFPAQKGLLADVANLDEDPSGWVVAMADGSTARRSTTDPPMKVEDLPRPFGSLDWRVLKTPEGILGRDY